ncbi:hypothetical protein PHMEG_00037731 [Phytophthora megakarya]|uniref:Uncharacterized protein n=1 Tax=Phytophthora megakarya TaxID=4795 RepID=A0A225UJB1_9STRA|nr:hypothetical protein PHMEG_00037731 [Phytophthora megakarya]
MGHRLRADESPEFDVKVSTLRHRIVSDDETEHWPGSYVGHPITFVQASGEATDQWAYGLVTGYSMVAKLARLHVRCGTTSLRVGLTTPPTIIAVDRLNYALRTGASLNGMTLNTLELLDCQNEVIVACGKSRSGLPASVMTTMLSMPFNPDEMVPLIKPDTLEIVSVRRQHIVDCELNGRIGNPTDVFTDSPAISDAVQLGSSPDMTNNINLAFSDSDDEGKTEDQVLQRDDINNVRLQNRSLHKRYRPNPLKEHDDLILDQVDIPVLQTTGDAQASAFRPSAMEKLVHDAVVHPSLLGKNSQFVIESARQGPRTSF